MNVPAVAISASLKTAIGANFQRSQKAFESTFAVAKKLKTAFERDEIKYGSDIDKIMAPFTKGIQFCAARIGAPGKDGSFYPIGTPSKKMAYIIYGPLFSDKSNEEKVSDWSH